VVSLALLAAVALVVGFSIGSTSIGGVLLVPALMAWGGLAVHAAAATTLASALFTGGYAAWLYARRGSLPWPLVWPLCAGGLPGGWLGAATAGQIAAQPLTAAIGALIVAASLAALRPPRGIGGARPPAAERALLATIGAGAAFCAGLSGAGGPIFSVPVMLLAGFAPLATIGAAMPFTIVASASGTAANLAAGTIDATLLAVVATFQLAGIAAGVRLAHALPVAVLRRAAIALCIVAGAAMIARAAL
jgi:hypothetical protein